MTNEKPFVGDVFRTEWKFYTISGPSGKKDFVLARNLETGETSEFRCSHFGKGKDSYEIFDFDKIITLAGLDMEKDLQEYPNAKTPPLPEGKSYYTAVDYGNSVALAYGVRFVDRYAMYVGKDLPYLPKNAVFRD